MQKGKSLRDKCFFFFFFLFISSNYETLLPLETVYTFHKGEQEVVFSMMKKRDPRLSSFFFFSFYYRRIFITLCINQIEEFIIRDINENDRVDLIGINSPEVDEIRRWPRTRMERNVNKIFAIKPRYSVDKVDHKREKLGALLV